MHTIRQDVFGEGASLPGGFLSHVTATTVEEALFQFVGCPAPPNRPDLRPYSEGTTEDYINQQIAIVEDCLLHAPDAPKDVEPEALLAIGAFTLESSIYKLLNGWGNLTQRTVEDLKYVAPFLKLLISALRSLPSRYKYEGFGVRILDASIPVLKPAFDTYKEHFAKGKSVNFHSVCSFGKDENLLQSFIERDCPVIVLQCSNVEGYLVEDISAMPRLGGPNEGEIIVEGPSFFTVIAPPVKIRNYVVVQIEFNPKKGSLYSYLPKPSVRVRNRPEPAKVIQDELKLEREAKERKEREEKEKTDAIERLERERLERERLERERLERERERLERERFEREIRERGEKERKEKERKEKERKEQERKEREEKERKARELRQNNEVIVIKWGQNKFCCKNCNTEFYSGYYSGKYYGYKSGIYYSYEYKKIYGSSGSSGYKYYYEIYEEEGIEYEFMLGDIIPCSSCGKKCIKFT